MATGSAQAARDRRDAAGYRQRVPQFEPKRCDTCRHSKPAPMGKQHGLLCELHRSGCKTHGVCEGWA